MVPAHCGLQINEKVDRIGQRGLKIAFEDQLSVPLSFEDAKARIKEDTKCRKSIVNEIEAHKKGLTVRKAEIALAQIYVGHTTKLHPV